MLKNWAITIVWQDKEDKVQTSTIAIRNDSFAAVLNYLNGFDEAEVLDCLVETFEDEPSTE